MPNLFFATFALFDQLIDENENDNTDKDKSG